MKFDALFVWRLRKTLAAGMSPPWRPFPNHAVARATMVAHEPLVLAGVELAEAAFFELSPAIKIERLVKDGEKVESGRKLLSIEGPGPGLCSRRRRVGLNFVQRLSGRGHVDAADSSMRLKALGPKFSTPAKTTPGLAAAGKIRGGRCGGGQNIASGFSTWCSSKTTIWRRSARSRPIRSRSHNPAGTIELPTIKSGSGSR